MRYISTRGEAPALNFEDVLTTGLASDGGLYVPQAWPRLDAGEIRRMRGLSYPQLASRLFPLFTGDSLSEAEIENVVSRAFSRFAHSATAPLKHLETDLWMMELFHGPTLAFKDYALQTLGELFDTVLSRSGRRLTIAGATSGDTGSAAISACRGRDALDIFILHPRGRVSEVQRRQMTTVNDANVHNIAIDGTFDDCQRLVKALFADPEFRTRVSLSAVNSINWGRIMAQVVYYFHAALALGAPDREVAFSVPTGNFGNVFAGYVARSMGLPVAQLIIGSNRNDILTRFLESGTMETRPVEPSHSPSMDIQVSSNFERYLFDLLEKDGAAVQTFMETFSTENRFSLSPAAMEKMRGLFSAARFSDEETLEIIRETRKNTGETPDPHTAIGIGAARQWKKTAPEMPVICLATAHPAKFPNAIKTATGHRPPLPARLSDLFEKPEFATDMAAELSRLKNHIQTALSRESS